MGKRDEPRRGALAPLTASACPVRLARVKLAGLVSVVLCAIALLLPASAGAYVYWTNYSTGAIGRAQLDGSGVQPAFIAAGTHPTGVAVDASHIYWSDEAGNTIGRANLDGSDRLPNFITGANKPTDVAIEGSHVYWVNSGNGKIGRANLDGSEPNQSFVSGLSGGYGIAADIAHLYWANFSVTNTIGRVDIGGATGFNQSFITGASFPHDVAVDASHVYWTNYANSTIGRANLDGSAPTQGFVSVGPSGAIYGIAVDPAHIYWADFETGTIGRVGLDGSAKERGFISAGSGAFGVAVDALPAATPVGPPAPEPTTPTPTAPPSNRFKLAKPKLNPKAGTATIVARLPGAGKLVLAGKGVKKVSRRVKAKGKLQLAIKPNGATRALLGKHGKAHVNLAIVFTPTGGTARTLHRGLTLKLSS